MENLNKKNKITDFELILNKNLSRRNFIKNGISFGLSGFVLGASLNNSLANNKTSSFDFQQVKTNTLDTVTIPENFTWQTVIRWGDPMWTEERSLINIQEEMLFPKNCPLEIIMMVCIYLKKVIIIF